MAASDEIRKTKRNKKSTTSGPVQQTSGSGSGSKPAGFVSSLVKILVYSSILIGLSSQFEATRPIYKEYAHPYVATYVQVSLRVTHGYNFERLPFTSQENRYEGAFQNCSNLCRH